MIRKLLFKNFLFVYRASQWIRQRFTYTGMLVLTVIVTAGVFGLNTRQTLSYQIVAFLLSIMIISFISILTYRFKFRINRLLPEYGTAGQAFEYRLNIHNNSAKTQYDMTFIDNLDYDKPAYLEFLATSDLLDKKRNFFDRFIGYPRLVSLIRKKCGAVIQQAEIEKIDKNESCVKTIKLVPLRRGYIYFREAIIAKTDPFGLVRKLNRYLQSDSLLILPKHYPFPDITLPGKRKYQHGGLTLASSVGDSEEFFSLRDYRPGDPVKAIHWKSYAKKGEPVIKEYQDEYFSRLGLVLDSCLEEQPDYLFEDAVSVAASIAISRHQQDELLDLMFVNDKAYRFTTGRGLAGTGNVLEILACVETSSEKNFDILSRLVLRHALEASGLVFIYLAWDKKRQDLIRQLRQKGVSLMVFVISESGDVIQTQDDPVLDIPGLFRILKAGEIEKSLNNIP